MPKVNLVSLKKHRYAGESLKPGDDFNAPVAHAKVLIALKRAKKALPVTAAEVAGVDPVIKATEPEPKNDGHEVEHVPEVPAAPVPAVTAYKRRDMTAETSAAPKPKRTYKRKSTTAKK